MHIDQSDDDIDKYGDEWDENVDDGCSDDGDYNDDDSNNTGNGNTGNSSNSNRSWYRKIAYLLQHVLKVSKNICSRLSTHVSIDEMMDRFKGRPTQTHRIKNKPIK